MPSILLKNIPANIHQAIKDRAKRHFRSINNEIIACLDHLLFPRIVDPEVQIEKARHLRNLVKGFLTDDVLEKMINEGRK
ncbi:MAG: Arc family DNA-binding protein [Candidatus Riflebacteria bacterium]|nr:Arc family DNA-binding protein [Candidatus Riflebacteria bacterium]